jgi:pilus assembly protein TadC
MGTKTDRQKEIVASLLDAMDSLATDLEAGLKFDEAISRWVKASDNALSHAFDEMMQEVQSGKKRREALMNAAKRLDVPKVTTFANALIQADEQNISMAETLRTLSMQMRQEP